MAESSEPPRKRRARNHACDVEGCGVTCACPSKLATHRRIHTGIKPFVCDFVGCDYSSAQAGSLKNHEYKHSDARPFECNFVGCAARFVKNSDLKMHTRTHTGVGLHVCDVVGCDYRSTRVCNLTAHKRAVHLGSRPHKCSDCGAAFSHSSNLRQHVTRIHTERGQQRQKKKEERVARFLTSVGVRFERETTIKFCSEGNKRFARVDFTIYHAWGVDVLEVDEFQHDHYPIACETARMLDIFAEQVKAGRLDKIRFLRYNPDAFFENTLPRKVAPKDRLERLRQTLATEPDKHFSLVYLFYNQSSPLPDVCFDPAYPRELREIASAA
jgi:hypothetical protein